MSKGSPRQRHRCLDKPRAWQRNLPAFLDFARSHPQIRKSLANLLAETAEFELRLRSDVQSLRAQAVAAELAAEDHLEAAQIMKSLLEKIDAETTR